MVPDTAPRKKIDLSEDPFRRPSKEEQQTPEAAMRSGLSELADFARRALEEKRRKDCLALTKAMLKIDPENQDAQVMQGWIQSDLQGEIQQAFALMRSARFTDSREAVERAGLMLQDVLDIDPDNQDAQILISRVESMLQGVPRMPVAPPLQKPVALPPKESAPIINEVEMDDEEGGIADTLEPPRPKWLRYTLIIIFMMGLGAGTVVLMTGVDEWRNLLGMNAAVDVVPGTLEVMVDEGVRIHVNNKYVGTAPMPSLNLKPGVYHLRYEFDGVDVGSEDVTVTSGETVANSSHMLLGRLDLLVVPAGDVQVRIDGKPAMPVPEYVNVKAGKHRLTFTANGYEPQTVSASVVAGDRSNVKAILVPAIPPAPAVKVPPPSHTGPSETTVGAPNGFLAISSPLPVEIFVDGRRVGSTPATLELSPGPHTLEYRYNGMSKTLVHVIESKQTTRASVTFE
jgi:PEGA domain